MGGYHMKCPRCQGLMVCQSFFDHFMNFEAWKCLNCGNIIARREKTLEHDVFSLFEQQQKTRSKR